MSDMERCMLYFSQICELARPVPAGFCADGQDAEQRALCLRKSIAERGVDAFVQACETQQAQNTEGQGEDDGLPHIEEPDGSRNACEVLLDCCLLDDGLFRYLIQTLKEKDGLGFFRLAQVTTRKSIDPDEFLYWFATKHLRAPEQERACVQVMDAVFARLAQEGERELLAALLSGDQKTFELFRCEAPELKQLPQATYSWYCENYLNPYYPLRFMLRYHGVAFPEVGL